MRATFIAWIPIKAHSERIYRKNFLYLAGEPLFVYVIDALLQSRHVDRIVINTDSDELINLIRARYDSVQFIKRDPSLCGDNVSVNDLFAHDLRYMNSDYYVQTHITNPLLTTDTIDAAIETYLNTSCDSLFTVTKHYKRFYDIRGNPVNHNPNELKRTQDIEPLIEENSCLYIFSEDSFLQNYNRIGEKPLMYSISPLEAIDIDTRQELILAEALIPLLRTGVE